MTDFETFLAQGGMEKEEWIEISLGHYGHWTGVCHARYPCLMSMDIYENAEHKQIKALVRAIGDYVQRLDQEEITRLKKVFLRFKEFVEFQNEVWLWLEEKLSNTQDNVVRWNTLLTYVKLPGLEGKSLRREDCTDKVPEAIRQRLAVLADAEGAYKRIWPLFTRHVEEDITCEITRED